MSSLDALAVLADIDWRHGDIGTGWWIVMMVMMVVFWAAVIASVVWLVRTAAAGGAAPRGRSPQERLDERLAAGEIGIEEYEQVSAALEHRTVAVRATGSASASTTARRRPGDASTP